MALHEPPHSGLVIRNSAYGERETEELVRDLVALANAFVTGPRYIILGVADNVDGGRIVNGVDDAAMAALQRILPKIATRIVEPPIDVELNAVAVQDRTVAVIVLKACADPPYLLRRDVSKTLHAGRGWVRRATEVCPLMREDLQRMLTTAAPQGSRIAELEIGFPGKVLNDEISLPVLPLDAMPSKLAAERLQKMLEGNAAARDVLGRTETQFNRLLHAQIFGSSAIYEKHSDDSLIGELDIVGEQHAEDDRRYEFEERAHRLQLEVRNNGDFDIEQATLSLTFQRLDGFAIAERIYSTGSLADASAYPLIDASQKRFVVQTRLAQIAAGRGRGVFREPLRLLLREASAGRTLLIDYKLQCRELPRPLQGSLRINVEAAAVPTARTQARVRSG